MRGLRTIGILCVAAFFLAGCSGGTDAPTGSNPVKGLYVGTVLDENGDPVAGAIVAIDGIQAKAVTDESGKYVVKDASLAVDPQAPKALVEGDSPGSIEVSVLAPGYEPLVQPMEVVEGETADVTLVQTSLEPRLLVSSPTGVQPFLVPTCCSVPKVRVEGYAKVSRTQSLRIDAIVVIDRSGSAVEEAADIDGDGVRETVLEVEQAGAQTFLAALDSTISRVAIVQFDDYADVVCGFTNDLEEASAAVGTIQVRPEHERGKGTNYEAAFLAAKGLFEDLAALDEAEYQPAEPEAPEIPVPLRAVVFLTDGIPTSHGVPPNTLDSNLTQSSADRAAAIAGAGELCASTEAQLFAFSIIPAKDTDAKRTTLPSCVAVCGGGHYENITDFATLISRLGGEPLEAELKVEIQNLTTGDVPLVATLYPDGFFSELVPVAMLGAPDTESPDTWTNTISVKLTAFSGKLEKSVEELVTVRLVPEAELAGGGSVTSSVQLAPKSVSELTELKTPTGGRLGDNGLLDFLKSEFEDARELYGVETFQVLESLGGPSVTLRIDYVYRQGCYRSDVGYVFIDPENPPRTAEEALHASMNPVLLFNSGAVGGSTCDVLSIPAGTWTRDIEIPEGRTLVFFLIPNATLAEYQAARNKKKYDPLFTLSSLNPGGFDQVLTFYSAAGRTEAGAGGAVVSEGPLTVFAFEDIAIKTGSDQDFTDVVFTVTSIQGDLRKVTCSE